MSKVGESRPKRAKTGGRKAGTPNKTTAALKDAILLAAEATGSDGQGKNGLTGYLRHVASTNVPAFAGLLGRVLPLQVGSEPDNPLRSRVELVIVDPQG